jgi:aspartyl-tRNA(Asn)/glutamyl-tRNA(Gln) amidotransferase subunit B
MDWSASSASTGGSIAGSESTEDMINFEAVIGLEVHAQLLTKSKMFCACSTVYGARANTHICPVCLGLPGALPVVNETAVEFAVRMGLATGSRIARMSVFARKNYFYPDCPKNYQISQYDQPLCSGGRLSVEGKMIGIERIHLEEDAGKLLHPPDEEYSLIDMNRSGIPLIEIVTKPDIRTPRGASRCLQQLRSILRYLDICDGNMEEGSLRCDVNVSLRPAGRIEYGTKTEIKNLNSFKAVEGALHFEIDRQRRILEQQGVVEARTLLWDKDKGEARAMRSKEEEHDYRYFPEPDLVQLEVTPGILDRAASVIPELPGAKEERFIEEYQLPREDAAVLTASRELADYFEAVVENSGDAKAAGNWILGEVLRELNVSRTSISQLSVTPRRLADLIAACTAGEVNLPTAKSVFKQMVDTDKTCEEIIRAGQLGQISDKPTLRSIVAGVLKEHEKEVQQYRNGKEQLFTFFMGQVMKKTGGRAHPQLAASVLKEEFDKKQ